MKKHIALCIIFLFTSATPLPPSAIIKAAHTILEPSTAADKSAWKQLQPLRLKLPNIGLSGSFSHRNSDKPHPFDPEYARVRSLLVTQHDAVPLRVTADDGQELAVLAHIRPEATTTLLFFNGYFDHLTPRKEWAAPFVAMFPDCNIVMSDWRHVGESANAKGDCASFGKNAHHDVVALLRLCRTHEAFKDTTLVAHSYCLGAAILLNTLVNHLPNPLLLPDALNLSSVPAKISDLEHTYHLGNPSWLFRTFFSIPPIRSYCFKKSVTSEIRVLEPAALLKQLSIPCNLEYCITGDRMIPLELSIPATYEEKLPANIHLTLAKKSRHVRLQTMADQYVRAQKRFWEKVILTSSDPN